MNIKTAIEHGRKTVTDALRAAALSEQPWQGASIRSNSETPYSRYFDHTLLKPQGTRDQFEQICHEALEWNTASVCIPPNRVALATQILNDSDVDVCAVVGFPLGYHTSIVKAAETRELRVLGCQEFDMVLSIGLLCEGDFASVYRDIRAVVEAAGTCPVKVILETALLDQSQKIIAGLLSVAAGAAMLKTSTGFAGQGATPEDVALLRAIADEQVGVKAAGGIHTPELARACVDAGADRLGTSATGILLGHSI